ncbi:MAG: hypothetical protein OJF47_004017 [Nitrospira sp.]|jgi:hypothetical protein|nr:MAG: hypothetical protein OJF47_004017 [Nitrospira sp.]
MRNTGLPQSEVPHRWGGAWLTIALATAALVLLPLIGVALAGFDVRAYLEFPPTTRYVVHEPFSWPVFIWLTMVTIGMVAPFVVRLSSSLSRLSTAARLNSRPSTDPKHRSRLTLHERRLTAGVFPWWGRLAVLWTLAAWSLAWTRFEWMRPFQTFTFTPLWLGYIVLVNALTFRRVGRCMLLHRPRYFLSLFPLSAAFWWFFEYLNRFVQNWYYLGGRDLTAWDYLWQATLPFSTVLPAVLGTAELLTASPRFSAGLEQFVKIDFGRSARWGWGLSAAAALGLLGIGLWPDYLFSLVWVAPLLSITALQLIRGEPTIFDGTARGDWRTLWSAAVAALICGCFWELWNQYSLAHWEYVVPFVQRFELFQMPLLGYAGYLPFGLECLAVADLCLARKFSGGVDYYRGLEGDADFAQRKPTVGER